MRQVAVSEGFSSIKTRVSAGPDRNLVEIGKFMILKLVTSKTSAFFKRFVRV